MTGLMNTYLQKRALVRTLKKNDMMMDLLDKSYDLVLAGFSKKKQMEILGQ